MVKNSHANTGDIRDERSIPGLGTHSSVLAWRTPWTEKLGGLQATGSQSNMTEAT